MSETNQAKVKKQLSEMALNLARVDEVRAKVGEIGSVSVKNKAAAFHDIHEALLDEHLAHKESQQPNLQ
jgi:hypothetical protein